MICLLKNPTNHESVPRLRTTRKNQPTFHWNGSHVYLPKKKVRIASKKHTLLIYYSRKKLKWQRKKPKHFVQISITLLTKTTILSALFLTVDFFRQVTRCRAWTMHIFVGAILLEIWMFGQHLHRDKCRKVFGIYIYTLIHGVVCF